MPLQAQGNQQSALLLDGFVLDCSDGTGSSSPVETSTIAPRYGLPGKERIAARHGYTFLFHVAIQGGVVLLLMQHGCKAQLDEFLLDGHTTNSAD
jgi:hypothetical protein